MIKISRQIQNSRRPDFGNPCHLRIGLPGLAPNAVGSRRNTSRRSWQFAVRIDPSSIQADQTLGAQVALIASYYVAESELARLQDLSAQAGSGPQRLKLAATVRKSNPQAIGFPAIRTGEITYGVTRRLNPNPPTGTSRFGGFGFR